MEKGKLIKVIAVALVVAVATSMAPAINRTMVADAASKSVKIDTKHFPDKAFRKHVRKFDTNKSGWLSGTERAKVKKMDVTYEKIKSLKGIGYFT